MDAVTIGPIPSWMMLPWPEARIDEKRPKPARLRLQAEHRHVRQEEIHHEDPGSPTQLPAERNVSLRSGTAGIRVKQWFGGVLPVIVRYSSSRPRLRTLRPRTGAPRRVGLFATPVCALSLLASALGEVVGDEREFVAHLARTEYLHVIGVVGLFDHITDIDAEATVFDFGDVIGGQQRDVLVDLANVDGCGLFRTSGRLKPCFPIGS